jgi:hypothetical protein
MDASTVHLVAVLAACIAPVAVWLLVPLHDWLAEAAELARHGFELGLSLD